MEGIGKDACGGFAPAPPGFIVLLPTRWGMEEASLVVRSEEGMPQHPPIGTGP